MRPIVRAIAALLSAGSLSLCVVPASAQTQTTAAAVDGVVIDVANGLPVANATVDLTQNGTVVATTHSDGGGAYHFSKIAPGIYRLSLRAEGYQSTATSDEALVSGEDLTPRNGLQRQQSGSSNLATIGGTATHSRALQASTVITRTLSSDLMQRESAMRIGDSLQTLPGVNANNLDSAPGDDLNIAIRGYKASESQTLIDDHPVGPIGALGGAGGGWNYQLSPSFALRDVQVAYGSGGASLYGVDAIAGTINFQTLDPTLKPSAYVKYGAGTQERQQLQSTFTGTIGKLGYALAYGSEGTNGPFSPHVIAQTGLLGTDFTSANLAANTYLVSGAYQMRSGLAKLRYDFSPRTSATATLWNATSFDDKTGEGDNDFVTSQYAYQTAFDTGSVGSDPTCPAGVVVKTNSGNQCLSPAQYAAMSSGPAGGGTPLAFQTQRDSDYALRISHQVSANDTLLVDGFTNAYYLNYDRDLAGHTVAYRTTGGSVSNVLQTGPNTLTLGYSIVHQSYGYGLFGAKGVSNNPLLYSAIGSAFLSDVLEVTRHLSFLGDLHAKKASVGGAGYADSRGSLVYRPTTSDVVRATLGGGGEAPAVQDVAQPLTLNNTPGNLNPACTGLTSVGSDSNAGLRPERSSDLEVSYGHRFHGDSDIQVLAFDSNVKNVIFSNTLPLTSFGANVDPTLLAGYLARIQNICGGAPSIANLGLSTLANAGAGRFRGFDIAGRWRFARRFYADYSWESLSARYFGIPTQVLQSSPTLIDGGQLDKVPIQKASLGLDYTDRYGNEVRLDGYYVGNNNPLLRPAYTYFNAAFTVPAGRFRWNLGVQNLFNSQSDPYGRIGWATYQPENQFFHDSNAIQEFNSGADGERFGLPERSVILSVSTHI